MSPTDPTIPDLYLLDEIPCPTDYKEQLSASSMTKLNRCHHRDWIPSLTKIPNIQLIHKEHIYLHIKDKKFSLIFENIRKKKVVIFET